MKLIAKLGAQEHLLTVKPLDNQGSFYCVSLDGRDYQVDAESMLIEGKSYELDIEPPSVTDPLDGQLGVRVLGRWVDLEILDERHKKMKDVQSAHGGEQGAVKIKSPMPGKILRIMVSLGDQVSEGQGLLVVEAMKMENELKSPKNGIVTEINVTAGASVESGASLLVIE